MPVPHNLKSLQKKIQAEIRSYYGFIPPVFLVIKNTPALLEKFWQQTCEIYNTPLPLFFQEKLFAVISCYLHVTLCQSYHTLRLHSLGVPIPTITRLMNLPPLTSKVLRKHIRLLEATPASLWQWPEADSDLEQAMLQCACALILKPRFNASCSSALRRLLSPEEYNALLEFLLYIRNCHLWIKSYGATLHDEIEREIHIPLDNLFKEHPELVYAICFDLNHHKAAPRRSQTRSSEQRALHTLHVIADALTQIENQELSEPTAISTETALEQIVRHVGNFLRCRCGGVFLLEQPKGSLIPVATSGLNEQQEAHLREHLADFEDSHTEIDDITITRLFDGNHVSINLKDMLFPWLSSFFLPLNVTQLHVVPLYSADRTFGFLWFGFENEVQLSQNTTVLTVISAKLILLMRGQELLHRELKSVRRNERSLLEAQTRVDEFISIANHEMRQPLTILKMTLQRLEQIVRRTLNLQLGENTTSQFKTVLKWLDRALLQVNVLSRLMNDLYIARFRSETLDLLTRLFDLTALVQRVVEEQHQLFPQRKFELRLQTTQPLLAVIDPERITQVLTNFIGNAVKYSPDGKPIIMRLTQQGQTALIEFQDQGPGISPEDQEHIWERSYRVEGIKPYHKAGANLGMGLYICRLIIQQHHGDYGIRSAPGQGSTFWFTLPLEIQCSDTPAQSQ